MFNIWLQEWIELKNQHEELLADNHRLKTKLIDAEQDYRLQLTKYADDIAVSLSSLFCNDSRSNDATTALRENDFNLFLPTWIYPDKY